MRFACDACHAQYLISDEKVGPAGVKVRCKKCGHVIVVRRSGTVSAAARAAAGGGGSGARGEGTAGAGGAASAAGAATAGDPGAPGAGGEGDPEAREGAAGGAAAGGEGPSPEERTPGPEGDGAAPESLGGVASASGDHPEGGSPGLAAGVEGEGSEAPDPEATRVFTAAELSHLAQQAESGEGGEPPPAEWFVAIDDAQVGPLSFAAVKTHWEEGRLDPESLCWRAGLGDWTPIARVTELVELLPPKAPAPAPGVPAAAAAPLPEIAGDNPWDLPPPEPTSELDWKPGAASALSALVEQEVAALGQGNAAVARDVLPEAMPAPESTGIRRLLQDLPEPPPPEPSRVIPFPERSQTGAQALPRPPGATPAASPAPPARSSGARQAVLGGLVAAAVVLLAVVGLVWAGVLPGGGDGPPAAPEAPVAAAPEAPAPAAPAPAPVPTPVPTPEPAAPAPEAPAAAVAEAEGSPQEDPPAPAVAAATPEPEPKEAPPAAPPPAVAAAEEPPRPAPVRRQRPRGERRVARQRQAPPPAPAPAPRPPERRSDIDALFEEEFAGGGAAASRQQRTTGRDDVYIPAAPGSRSKPARLGQGDVMGVVVGHKAAIKKCADQYKASGGGTGTLVMLWTIQPSGKTSNVRPKGGDHAPLAKCIGGLIRGWKFPEYSGPTMAPIEFPFQF